MSNELIKHRVRLNRIIARGKNHDCPGVERKIRRQIRNEEKHLEQSK